MFFQIRSHFRAESNLIVSGMNDYKSKRDAPRSVS